MRDEKLHAIVARSQFRSQNAQKHFWKVRRGKSAHQCCTKVISKSKCANTFHLRGTFGSWDVEEVHAVVARSSFRSWKCKKLTGLEHFFDVQMIFCLASRGDCTPCQENDKTSRFVSTTATTLHYMTLHYTTLHYANRITLRFTTLHYTTLHYATLHYAAHKLQLKQKLR